MRDQSWNILLSWGYAECICVQSTMCLRKIRRTIRQLDKKVDVVKIKRLNICDVCEECNVVS